MPRHQLAALRAVRIGTLNGLVHWMLPQSLQGGSATGLSVTGALGRAVAGDAPMVRQPELSVDPQRPPLTHSASRWAQVNRSRKYAYATATLWSLCPLGLAIRLGEAHCHRHGPNPNGAYASRAVAYCVSVLQAGAVFGRDRVGKAGARRVHF